MVSLAHSGRQTKTKLKEREVLWDLVQEAEPVFERVDDQRGFDLNMNVCIAR